jgi:hypothetical protein
MERRTNAGTKAVALFVVLHLLCCGVPLLVLSGVSLSFVFPSWPLIGAVLAIIGIVGLSGISSTGAPRPRNEGRCELR